MRLLTNKTQDTASVTYRNRTLNIPAGQTADLLSMFTYTELADSTSLVELLGQGTDKYQLNDGTQDLSVSDAIHTILNIHKSTINVVQAHETGNAIPANFLPASPGMICNGFMELDGEYSLKVNGSSVSKEFTFDALVDHNLRLMSIELLMISCDLKFGENKFGNKRALSNGLLVNITLDDTTHTLHTIKRNDDLFHFSTEQPGVWPISRDVLYVKFDIGGIYTLAANSTDRASIVVQDDLRKSVRGFECFVHAIKEAV